MIKEWGVKVDFERGNFYYLVIDYIREMVNLFDFENLLLWLVLSLLFYWVLEKLGGVE